MTPKHGAQGRQPRAVLPGMRRRGRWSRRVYGLLRSHHPSTLNNVAFALVHVSVLAAGIAPALRGAPARTHPAATPPGPARAETPGACAA